MTYAQRKLAELQGQQVAQSTNGAWAWVQAKAAATRDASAELAADLVDTAGTMKDTYQLRRERNAQLRLERLLKAAK